MKVQFSNRINNKDMKENEAPLWFCRGVKSESQGLSPLRADHRVHASPTISKEPRLPARKSRWGTQHHWSSRRLFRLQWDDRAMLCPRRLLWHLAFQFQASTIVALGLGTRKGQFGWIFHQTERGILWAWGIHGFILLKQQVLTPSGPFKPPVRMLWSQWLMGGFPSSPLTLFFFLIYREVPYR